MRPPNLFKFATRELSQDAFICWLISWAKPEYREFDSLLHATATEFLDRLLEVAKCPKVAEYRTVKLSRQLKHIDVLVLINNDIAIIIEDKTNSMEHSDQLRRYQQAVADKFRNRRVAAIYLKTGDQCDYGSVEQAGYVCFLRDEFLKVLQSGIQRRVKNQIFLHFCRYLQDVDKAIKRFRSIPPEKWKTPQWKGFFMALKEKIGDGQWGHRAHPGRGSLPFWWHLTKDKEYYLVLNGGELGFKIEVSDQSQQEAKRNQWYNMLLAKNETTGIRIKRSRRQLGKRMKVAVLNGDYRQKDGEGLLDLDQTVAVLKKAENLMDTALGTA